MMGLMNVQYLVLALVAVVLAGCGAEIQKSPTSSTQKGTQSQKSPFYPAHKEDLQSNNEKEEALLQVLVFATPTATVLPENTEISEEKVEKTVENVEKTPLLSPTEASKAEADPISAKIERISTPNSSWVRGASYDFATQMLTVQTDGKNYDYAGVPVRVWEDFKTADSAGAFINKNLKGKY